MLNISMSKHLVFLSILLISLPISTVSVTLKSGAMQTVIAPNDPYWPPSCTNPTIPQSPINVNPPFTYMEFQVEWDFEPYPNGYLENDENFVLQMDGDYGNFEYENETFSAYQIQFHSPSQHTFGPANTQFPLEMDVMAISASGVRINIGIFFTESNEEGGFLSEFGFGAGILQHLMENQNYEVPQPINLNMIIPQTKHWLIYQGSDTTPPCSAALWFLSFDTYKASPAQIQDFPKLLLYKNRILYNGNTEIFASFMNLEEVANSEEENSEELNIPQTPPLINPSIDSFYIAEDDTPYADPIYPSILPGPNPRPITNNDYIVVTKPGDATPFVQYFELNENKLDNMLNLMEDRKISNNIKQIESEHSSTLHGGNTPPPIFIQTKKSSKKANSESDKSGKSILDGEIAIQTKIAKIHGPAPRSPDNFLADLGMKKNEQFKPIRNPFFSFLQIGNQMKLGADAKLATKTKLRLPEVAKEALIEVEHNSLMDEIRDQLREKTSSTYTTSSNLFSTYSSSLSSSSSSSSPSSSSSVTTSLSLPSPSSSVPDIYPSSNSHTESSSTDDSTEAVETESISSVSEGFSGEATLEEGIDFETSFTPQVTSAAMVSTYEEEEIVRSENVEDGWDSSEEEDQSIARFKVERNSENGLANSNTEVVFGPKVPVSVRNEFQSDNGRGQMAYNSQGEWDGYPIYTTSSWPDLCKIGTQQSPININFASNFDIETNELFFNYTQSNDEYVQLTNNGYILQLSGNFGSVKYGEHPFFVEEIQFHHPSEHTFGVNMERADFEIEIIHRDEFGLPIAVSIFFILTPNAENTFFDQLGFTQNSEIPPISGGQTDWIPSSKVQIANLVEEAFAYIRYEGSLTTPPCTEGVRWFLMSKKLPVTTANIEAFEAISGMQTNIRGVQPLNNRNLWLF